MTMDHLKTLESITRNVFYHADIYNQQGQHDLSLSSLIDEAKALLDEGATEEEALEISDRLSELEIRGQLVDRHGDCLTLGALPPSPGDRAHVQGCHRGMSQQWQLLSSGQLQARADTRLCLGRSGGDLILDWCLEGLVASDQSWGHDEKGGFRLRYQPVWLHTEGTPLHRPLVSVHKQGDSHAWRWLWRPAELDERPWQENLTRLRRARRQFVRIFGNVLTWGNWTSPPEEVERPLAAATDLLVRPLDYAFEDVERIARLLEEWHLRGALVNDRNRCFDLDRSRVGGGTRLQLWECNGTHAQDWVFYGDGTLKYAMDREHCATRRRKVTGTRQIEEQLVLSPCVSGDRNQQFTLGPSRMLRTLDGNRVVSFHRGDGGGNHKLVILSASTPAVQGRQWTWKMVWAGPMEGLPEPSDRTP